MDITQRAAKLFPLETTGEPYQTHTLEKIKVVRELVIEIERLRVERIELFKESSNAADEIEQLREALLMWDYLMLSINTAAREAMSDITHAARHTAQLLYGDPPWPSPRPALKEKE